MFRLGTGAKIGLIVGLAGGLIGILAAVAAAPVTGGLTALLIVGVFAVVYLIFLRPLFRANRILKTGEPAQALIKEVRDTGVTINNAPQVELLLEVRPRFKPPYEAKAKTLVSRLQPDLFRPGMTVAVKFDPKDPTAVAVDLSGAISGGGAAMSSTGGAAPKTEAQAMKEATEFDALNRKLMASGESAKATIVQATPLGFQVNGNNPAMELLVEVTPEGKPKFLSLAKGIIAEASVPKYQPGHAIYVKFNPADTTHVAIERSA